MNRNQLKELILQSLEHERGGIRIYEAALQCVINGDLKQEFDKYLQQTRNHERILLQVCASLGWDAEESTPGRSIVKSLGQSLVNAIKTASSSAPDEAAELVACECVFLAETKDHANWQLITKCAEKAAAAEKESLQSAADEVEDQEDEHLYHSKGWCRELWLQSLGLKAMLPPPEERHHVTTAIGAARAEHARK